MSYVGPQRFQGVQALLADGGGRRDGFQGQPPVKKPRTKKTPGSSSGHTVIGSIADKFESAEVRVASKKRGKIKEIPKLEKREKEKQQEQSKTAHRRIPEQLGEEEARLKSGQAFREKSTLARQDSDEKCSVNNQGGVSSKDRIMRSASDNMTGNPPMSLTKSGSGLAIYTRGVCSSIKDTFETADKKGEQPVAPARRSIGKSKNLPNMFQQKEKREAEFKKQKQEGKPNIPMNKKIFTNFLDR